MIQLPDPTVRPLPGQKFTHVFPSADMTWDEIKSKGSKFWLNEYRHACMCSGPPAREYHQIYRMLKDAEAS